MQIQRKIYTGLPTLEPEAIVPPVPFLEGREQTMQGQHA